MITSSNSHSNLIPHCRSIEFFRVPLPVKWELFKNTKICAVDCDLALAAIVKDEPILSADFPHHGSRCEIGVHGVINWSIAGRVENNIVILDRMKGWEKHGRSNGCVGMVQLVNAAKIGHALHVLNSATDRKLHNDVSRIGPRKPGLGHDYRSPDKAKAKVKHPAL
jgi:hypothetical protein